MEYTLVIGNKNYSSWSLRAWLAMKATGAAFREVMISLRQPDTRQQALTYSPSGKVPVLITGKMTVWDSLAIGETLAEWFPDAGLWPSDSHTRAHARAICAEMHSGFMPLRSKHPMAMRERTPQTPDEDVAEIIARIEHLWREARALPGRSAGEFLYGGFSLADAFYAPVVSRFVTYGFPVSDDSRRYMEAVWHHPDFADWYSAAEREP